MEKLWGNFLHTLGRWVVFTAPDIAKASRHSNGKHGLWKTYLVPGNTNYFSNVSPKFRAATQLRAGTVAEWWKAAQNAYLGAVSST